MHIKNRTRGMSLIEVLIAVLIFSLGLLGLAGLLTTASRSNHAAYLRTQASLLAENMAERMRANPRAMWDGAYSANYPVSSGLSGDPPDCHCNPGALAVRDRQQWSRLLTQFLPDGKASISCTAPVLAADSLAMRPPYGGDCEMSIRWTERPLLSRTLTNDLAKTGVPMTQSLDWRFEP